MLEQLVHAWLEGGRRVRQSKRHEDKFEVSVMGSKCHFFNIVKRNVDLMVPDLVKIVSPCSSSISSSILWIRKAVSNRGRVYHAIVHAESPCRILLVDQENWRWEGAEAMSDQSLLEHLSSQPLDLVLLEVGVMVREYVYGFGMWLGRMWWSVVRIRGSPFGSSTIDANHCNNPCSSSHCSSCPCWLLNSPSPCRWQKKVTSLFLTNFLRPPLIDATYWKLHRLSRKFFYR